MNSAPSTSSVIRRFFGDSADEAIRGEFPLLERVIEPFPAFREEFMSVAAGRASFIIPQTCVFLAYAATCGQAPTAEQLDDVSPFALLCLSLAAGDDLIDEPARPFASRMVLGWTAMILNRHAYYRILDGRSTPSSMHLRRISDSLVSDVTEVAAIEVRLSTEQYEEATYLSLARRKTSAYTRHALQLGCLVAGGTAEVYDTLTQIGNHLGTAIQMLDDALDAPGDDGTDQPPTMATMLRAEGRSLSRLYDTAITEIERAIQLAKLLPHPQALLDPLRRAATFLRFAK